MEVPARDKLSGILRRWEMISINIHPVASTGVEVKINQLTSCVTLVISYEGNEVVYYLKTVDGVREILHTMQKALDQRILGFDHHTWLVDQIHRIMDQAAVEYDEDFDVVDDFTRYVKDWASRRSEASLDRVQGI
jgi:hypothetical protein